VKNLVNWQYLLFTEPWRHSKFVNNLCKIRREKHPRAFVKVVEGSEIYNFPIHHLVHFSCKNSSYGQSNSARPKFFWQAATPPALQRAGAPARAFPRPCSPEAGGHSEALRSAPTPRGARPLAGRPCSAVPCGPRGAPLCGRDGRCRLSYRE
jgi:hypothetical protein